VPSVALACEPDVEDDHSWS